MSGVRHATASALRLTAVVLLMWPPSDAGAQASSAPINTDRPSFTNTPRVVGERTVQIETGVAFSRDSVERDLVGEVTTSVATAPNLLVRLGMARQIELRVETEGGRWVDSSPVGDSNLSLSGIGAAIEYQFAAQEGLGADLAVIAGAKVPLTSGITPERVGPFVRLVWGRALSGSTRLGGTFNWSLPASFEAGRIRTLEGSLVAGFAVGDAWRSFAEAVARHQDVGDADVQWIGNAGVLRTIGNDVQLDVWLGRGLNEAAPDWAVGAGLSLRLHR